MSPKFVFAALEEKLGDKKPGHMLHMMSVLEQEGPAFAERPVSTLLGSIPHFPLIHLVSQHCILRMCSVSSVQVALLCPGRALSVAFFPGWGTACKVIPLLFAGGSHAREQVQHSEKTMPLQMALHNFFLGRGGDMPAVHRLAILSPAGDIEHILTQMDILRYMNDRHGSDPAASKTLDEAGVSSIVLLYTPLSVFNPLTGLLHVSR